MTNDTESSAPADQQESGGSPAAALLAQLWYPLGPPWAIGDYAGTVILAGNEDPHIGTAVCDTFDMLAEESDIDTARAVADHIIKLHNDYVSR